MLRSVYIIAVYVAFIVAGAAAPFVFSLGYVWVDTFTPQNIAYFLLPSIPVSMIMAVAALGSYFAMDRRSPPPVGATLILTLLLAVWVTLSTALWSVAPASAWQKWDYAFKTIAFSAFIPYVFRSRVQIEAFLQIYVFSLIVNFMPVGLKTMISGGGYGMDLGVVAGNSGLSEGSTLAAVSLMTVPIMLFLRRHGVILKPSKLTDAVYFGLIIAAIAAAIGTYERTGLVGMLILGFGVWLRARRKLLGAMIGAAASVVIIVAGSATWSARIATTTDYKQEVSALGRLLVWQWTLGFAAEHPQGGGFNAYEVNRIVFPANAENPEPVVVYGKAFHSIYFEMLGEQGWPGLALFFGLIGTSLVTLQRVARRSRRREDLAWCRDLAFALQTALCILLACGAFIGIAFQPMLYYMFAISASLSHFVSRIERADAAPAPNRRGMSFRDRRTLASGDTKTLPC